MDSATLAWLLSQLGTNSDVADLEIRYERLGQARAVAIEVLYQRKADLIAQPASVNVNGVVSITNTENIKAIERQIAYLQSDDAPPAPDEHAEPAEETSSGFGTIQLVERPRR